MNATQNAIQDDIQNTITTPIQNAIALPDQPSDPALELSSAPTIPTAEGEPLRHILLGTPGGIRQTIHLLHTLRYVENVLWSPLVPIPNDQLIITPRQGEVMSILVKNLR